MVDYLKTLSPSALIALILAFAFVFKGAIDVLAWFLKDYWSDHKINAEKRDKALIDNTMAIVKLQVQIEGLIQALSIVPKLKDDIDRAHAKIRDLQNGQNPSPS